MSIAAPYYKIVNGFPVIDAGALRHVVSIMSQTTATYDASGTAVTWTPLLWAHAAIDTNPHRAGTDVIKAGQTVSQLFLTVTLWYQPGIVPNMRVAVPTGNVYVIQSVENILEMNRVLLLNCIGIGSNV